MTLQRRLIIAVLLAAPLAWMLTIAGTYWRANHEINELYDSDMLRLAEQTLAVASFIPASVVSPSWKPSTALPPASGDASRADLAVAIWRGASEPLVMDSEASQFPRQGALEGFLESTVAGAPWRIYYLNDPANQNRVAVGQRIGEREDLVVAYIVSQIMPSLLGLPILIALLAFSVRRALKPVRDLCAELEQRSPDDATPLAIQNAPGELKMLVSAMNGLLLRVAGLIDHERRLTADAAHELRTPLAALRAHWDVVLRSHGTQGWEDARDCVTRGIERLGRLVTQLLTMAKLDSGSHTDFGQPVDWRHVADQAMSDCLWLANRRDIDIDIDWTAPGESVLPMAGDAESLTVLLRNLLDNAIRYSPRQSHVRLVFTPTRIWVDDQGAGIAADVLPRLGDRFLRAAGNEESGSGLGVSIARRIAARHGLALHYAMREPDAEFGPGLRVSLQRGG